MHFSTILALSSLAGTIQAAAIQATRGHAAQFRIFGKPGCFAENEGFFLVQQGQIRPEQCYGYENNTVESLWVEQIRHGCRLMVYSDEECREGTLQVPPNKVCENAAKEWKGWMVLCNS